MDCENIANRAQDARDKIEELLSYLGEKEPEFDTAIEKLEQIIRSAEVASEKIDNLSFDLKSFNQNS